MVGILMDAETLSKIDRFGDVPVPVDVLIGFKNMTVSEIMELKPGGTVLLNKAAGETLDIVIGNLRIGSVEVVVVEDRLAVRITETDHSDSREAAKT